MPMQYANVSIADHEVPKAAFPFAQHLLDTYASETNKVATVWFSFRDEDLSFRPHTRSATVLEVLRHQMLSERRFFAEFLGTAEPPADAVLPATPTVAAYRERFLRRARRGSIISRRMPSHGGSKPFRSSTSHASGSGSSGDACCIRLITGRSSRSTCASWTAPSRRHTARPRTSPGPERIPPIRRTPPRDANVAKNFSDESPVFQDHSQCLISTAITAQSALPLSVPPTGVVDGLASVRSSAATPD